MFKLFRHLKGYTWRIAVACVLLFMQAMFDLSLPDILASMVDQGIAVKNMDVIFQKGWLMVLAAAASGICAIVVGLLASRVGAGFARDVRNKVFAKVSYFAGTEFNRFSVSSLITRSTNDITQIQLFVIALIRIIFYAPIVAIGGAGRAVIKSHDLPHITMTIGILAALIVSLVVVLFIIMKPKFDKIQNVTDNMSRIMLDSLSGMLAIRAFNTERYEEGRFDKVNQELTGLNLFINKIQALSMPGMILFLNGVSITMVALGAFSSRSAADVGNMMAFIQYGIQMIFSFMMVTVVVIMMPRASASAARIVEVLDCEPMIRDAEKVVPFPGDRGVSVEFRDVSFRYPDAEDDVLSHISFAARSGETTAFIGSTGSGKSTVVNLIPRIYDVTGGSILVGGVDIRDITQKELHSKIAFVPQKGVLFSGTIESNLRLGKENASAVEIKTAAQVAQAWDFIANSEEKLGRDVAQGGVNVSGGQKQRLSIARALLKKAPILIFDDSFSALDFKTDAQLRKALENKRDGTTTLIVAQRVSTIMRAEQIIVLDNGKIAGIGKHKDLLQSCETYREIAASQLSEEELGIV